MSARQRRAQRDQQRRSHSQNLLVDTRVALRAIDGMAITRDESVVEIGPGRRALTMPLARAGARIVAVERDHRMADGLDAILDREGLGAHVRVLRLDARRFRWPREPFRVVSNLPFAATTDLLAHMLDDPDRGPWRADVLVQREVARKRSAQPPTSLRSAAWAPWWAFHLGAVVPRTAFRPVPRVDAAWLTIVRRDPPVLRAWLAPSMRDTLRDVWHRPSRGPGSA